MFVIHSSDSSKHFLLSLSNFPTKNCFPFQTSEFDALDWSPATNDNILMGGIDDFFWTSDTLFSAINSSPNLFWPDPREIGKDVCYRTRNDALIIQFFLLSLLPIASHSQSRSCRFHSTKSWTVAAKYRRLHERNTIPR